jgi:hypothetical protein
MDNQKGFTKEMLIEYLQAIGCVGIGRGEFTRFNAPWEGFAIALAMREGYCVDDVVKRVSLHLIDGKTFLADELLAQVVDVDLETVRKNIQAFRELFDNQEGA